MFRHIFLILFLMTAVSCSRDNNGPKQNDKNQKQLNVKEEKQGNPTAIPDSAQKVNDWKVEYEQMNALLELSEQEKNDLKTAFETREKEVSEWMAEKGEKLKELEKNMFQAARSKDLSGISKYKRQAEPLRDEIRALAKKHQTAVLVSISKENQFQWKGNLLSAKLLNLMSTIALNEEQVTKIQAEAVKAAEASVKEPNPDAAGFLKLEKSVEKKILTVEQKREYEAIKKKNPLRSLDFNLKDLKRLMDFQRK